MSLRKGLSLVLAFLMVFAACNMQAAFAAGLEIVSWDADADGIVLTVSNPIGKGDFDNTPGTATPIDWDKAILKQGGTEVDFTPAYVDYTIFRLNVDGGLQFDVPYTLVLEEGFGADVRLTEAYTLHFMVEELFFDDFEEDNFSELWEKNPYRHSWQEDIHDSGKRALYSTPGIYPKALKGGVDPLTLTDYTVSFDVEYYNNDWENAADGVPDQQQIGDGIILRASDTSGFDTTTGTQYQVYWDKANAQVKKIVNGTGEQKSNSGLQYAKQIDLSILDSAKELYRDGINDWKDPERDGYEEGTTGFHLKKEASHVYNMKFAVRENNLKFWLDGYLHTNFTDMDEPLTAGGFAYYTGYASQAVIDNFLVTRAVEVEAPEPAEETLEVTSYDADANGVVLNFNQPLADADVAGISLTVDGAAAGGLTPAWYTGADGNAILRLNTESMQLDKPCVLTVSKNFGNSDVVMKEEFKKSFTVKTLFNETFDTADSLGSFAQPNSDVHEWYDDSGNGKLLHYIDRNTILRPSDEKLADQLSLKDYTFEYDVQYFTTKGSESASIAGMIVLRSPDYVSDMGVWENTTGYRIIVKQNGIELAEGNDHKGLVTVNHKDKLPAEALSGENLDRAVNTAADTNLEFDAAPKTYHMKAAVKGDNIKFYINDVLYFDYTDPLKLHEAGAFGRSITTNYELMDNWLATTVVEGEVPSEKTAITVTDVKATNDKISVTFSADVTGANTEGIQVLSGEQPVTVSKAVSGSTLDITTEGGFGYETPYTVSIPAGFGNDLVELKEAYKQEITTDAAPAPAALHVQSYTAAKEAVVVTFDGDVTGADTANAGIYQGNTKVEATCAAQGTTLTITPAVPLAAGSYEVVINAGFGVAGLVLDAEYRQAFTIAGEPEEPSALASFDADADGITLDFGKGMVTADIHTDDIELTLDGEDVPFTPVWQMDNEVLRLEVEGGMQFDKLYTLNLPAGFAGLEEDWTKRFLVEKVYEQKFEKEDGSKLDQLPAEWNLGAYRTPIEVDGNGKAAYYALVNSVDLSSAIGEDVTKMSDYTIAFDIQHYNNDYGTWKEGTYTPPEDINNPDGKNGTVDNSIILRSDVLGKTYEPYNPRGNGYRFWLAKDTVRLQTVTVKPDADPNDPQATAADVPDTNIGYQYFAPDNLNASNWLERGLNDGKSPEQGYTGTGHAFHIADQPATTYRMKAAARGHNLKYYLDGHLGINYTDEAIPLTGGFAFASGYDNSVVLDNIIVTRVVEAGTTVVTGFQGTAGGITVTFDKSVADATDFSMISVTADGTPVENLSFAVDGNELTITSADGFAAGVEYAATIGAGFGGTLATLAEAYTNTFSLTAGDVDVESFTASMEGIEVTFTGNIEGAKDSNLIAVEQDGKKLAASYTAAGNVLTITPEGGLAVDTPYDLVISKGYGNGIVSTTKNFVQQFMIEQLLYDDFSQDPAASGKWAIDGWAAKWGWTGREGDAEYRGTPEKMWMVWVDGGMIHPIQDGKAFVTSDSYTLEFDEQLFTTENNGQKSSRLVFNSTPFSRYRANRYQISFNKTDKKMTLDKSISQDPSTSEALEPVVTVLASVDMPQLVAGESATGDSDPTSPDRMGLHVVSEGPVYKAKLQVTKLDDGSLNIKFWYGGELYFDYTDNDPLPSGTIGFGDVINATPTIDNLRVTNFKLLDNEMTLGLTVTDENGDTPDMTNATALQGTVSVRNYTAESKPAQVIVGVYGANNKLISAKVVTEDGNAALTVAAGETKKLSYAFTGLPAEAKEVRVFMWDSFSSLTPYGLPYIYPQD